MKLYYAMIISAGIAVSTAAFPVGQSTNLEAVETVSRITMEEREVCVPDSFSDEPMQCPEGMHSEVVTFVYTETLCEVGGFFNLLRGILGGGGGMVCTR